MVLRGRMVLVAMDLVKTSSHNLIDLALAHDIPMHPLEAGIVIL
jgi:hypothetical protein